MSCCPDLRDVLEVAQTCAQAEFTEMFGKDPGELPLHNPGIGHAVLCTYAGVAAAAIAAEDIHTAWECLGAMIGYARAAQASALGGLKTNPDALAMAQRVARRIVDPSDPGTPDAPLEGALTTDEIAALILGGEHA